jgi:hypothetical protein
MSQMDIKRKTCDIRTWKKHLFLGISSTNIDTLVPSLYQCVETRSKSFDCCLSHFCTSISTSSSEKRLPYSCEQLYATNTSHRKREIFLWPFFAFSPFAHRKKNAQQNSALQYYTQERSPFLLLKPASEHAHARLLPRVSWTVLLPSDTNRKPITSITDVLLPFVTYLLTLTSYKEHRLRLYAVQHAAGLCW